MPRNTVLRALAALVMVAGIVAAPVEAGAVGFTPGMYGDSVNLLVNGDAETGDLTGWTDTSFTVDGSSPLSGSYSFAADLGNWSSNSWIYQHVDLSPYATAIDAGDVDVVLRGLTSVGSPTGGNIQCYTSVELDTDAGVIAIPGVIDLLYDVPVGARSLTVQLVARNIDFDNGNIAVSGCAPKWDNVELLLIGLPTCDDMTATHIGTSGPDVITGTGDDDVIVSLGGDDEVHGLAGDDVICLGPGADLAHGGYGSDLIFGEAGRDVIYGDAHSDVIHGGGAKDRIYGNGNADHLYGEEGHDRIRGGVGEDAVFGGEGNDTVIGNGGDDYLLGEGGDDTAKGKVGTDACDAETEYSCETEPT